jgi:hypothetical protein
VAARSRQRQRRLILCLAGTLTLLLVVTIRSALEPGPWQKVYATREGELGKRTSTGHIITSASRFVALPHPIALHKHVEVRYGHRAVVVPVLDVGPWNIDDAYWSTGERPAAERSRGYFRKPSNRAGIDLSDAVFAELGLGDNDWVEWRFVHKGYMVLPWL